MRTVGRLALTLALVNVITLDIIIAIGAGLPNSAAGARMIAVTVPIMDACLVISSVLLCWILFANRFRFLGALFVLNIVVLGVAEPFRLAGTLFPRWALFTADVYWLNLYLVGLSRGWVVLTKGRAA